ncbi:MAG: adenylate/guanylate cyclase domain-containing protein, partial [Bdellovibrionales bacterium]
VKKVLKSEFFKDKILVLGATAIGVFDLRVTPFDENYPGVETHANVIDNLVRKDFLFTVAAEEHYMPLAILALGVFLSIALSYAGALWGLGISLFTAFIIAYIDKTFLFSQGKVVSIVLPLFQVGFSYMCLTFYKYLTEERNKKELRATFSKYVSPAIVEEVLRHPKNLELGGRKEKVTVFFSDVRGFTTISEKLDPRALSDLLNSYLTPMTDLIFKNKGTLDKYMGDAIMAFFGAPVHYEDHAKMACSCALQNMAKLQELKVEYARKNLPPIDIGIGLNTGEVSVGNMGSESVRSYTVMGDAVNLASRLEGINKSYGTHIIISEFTQKEVAADFTTREVDLVRVKGKLQPIRIFELLAEGRPIAQIQENLKIFEEAYQLYLSKKFEKAIETFEKALQKYELDETSKIYIERCQDLIINPPPPDWDGVFVMKTK